MPDDKLRKRVDAFFVAVAEDLEAAEALTKLGNRLAAYHVEQAIEKLVKAALLTRGMEAGIEHRLDVLMQRLPEDDVARAQLWPLRGYTVYATAFRYPTPGGRLVASPPKAQLDADLKALREHIAAIQTALTS